MVGYLAAVWRCRFFWLSLVKMDLRTRYRRSVLGLGWSLLHPIAMTAILCFVFHRIFGVSLESYAPSVMVGLAFWNFFQSATLTGCQCFFQGEPYIRQFPSPLAIYPLRTALGAGVHFAIALGVALLFSSYFLGLRPPLVLLSLVPTLVLLFVLGWGLAVLGGLANTMFQDCEHIATVGFQMLFYATPIIYTEQVIRDNGLTRLMSLNPLVFFLDLLREPIVHGHYPSGQSYAAAAATVLVVAGTASFLLNRLQRRFIFYL